MGHVMDNKCLLHYVISLIFIAPAYCMAAPNATVVPDADSSIMYPVNIPRAIKTIEIYDGVIGKRKEVDVRSLVSSDIRKLLTSYETFISISKTDSSGSITYLGASGKVSKGTYTAIYDYVNYTNENITPDSQSKSVLIGRIGVGLRVTASVEVTDKNVDIGGLIPLGIAARNGKAKGTISLYVYGMSNDKIGLLIPGDAFDLNSIHKAFEAAANMKLIVSLDETSLEPYLIGVSGVKPESAKDAVKIANEKLAR